VFDQREELPLLPFGNPIGFVFVSRGRVYVELKRHLAPHFLTESHVTLDIWLTILQSLETHNNRG